MGGLREGKGKGRGERRSNQVKHPDVSTPFFFVGFIFAARYESGVVKGALAGLAQQSKAVLLRTWMGFESTDGYSGTGRRVYENYGADTAEGYSYVRKQLRPTLACRTCEE